MKTRISVLIISLTLGIVSLQTTAFGSDKDVAAELRCASTFGSTGAALPRLIQEAIKVFPTNQFALQPDQVVYISDFNGFVDCMGIESTATRNYLVRQQLLVFHNDFPIYFNESEDAIAAFRTDPRSSYLKYVFASFLGNGWIHATGEKSDFPAYSFELSLLQMFKKKLPTGDRTEEHFDEVRTRIEESRSSEQKIISVVRTAQGH